MFALVEDGSITRYFNGKRGFTLGYNQYPKAVFTLWTNLKEKLLEFMK